MKKILAILFILFLIFIVFTYWSVSVQPEEVKLSEVIEKENKNTSSTNDSVWVIASNLYEGNGLKNFMQGKNYREAWATPIRVATVNLDTLLGGMRIVEEGGGHQTHSLKLKAPSGILYSLRSINKDPTPVVPDIARDLGLKNIVIDGISAQHPFGALLSAPLSEAAGVIHTHPRLFYVPKQKKLGKYNEAYGDKLYYLEYETEGKVNWTTIDSVMEILDTDDLQELRQKYGKRVSVDKETLVRARLFDLLIGDWDRHAKQWGWVVQKKDSSYFATPLAGDRDNAFFSIDGVLPAILTQKWIQPLVRSYEEEIDYMPGLVYPVDVYFLKNTPEEIFVEQAEYLQQHLTDDVLEAAFKAWPREINLINKKEILKKLKARREKLREYALEFKKEIDNKDLLQEPLKGSEDLELPEELLQCFDCN
ncbi:hypothetical protein [Salinimicrobium soli]|uniref:hypothetical protein n=1 Tax=Salinimicrobium soli TaxID=1254399 RepID=UPI003AAEA698